MVWSDLPIGGLWVPQCPVRLFCYMYVHMTPLAWHPHLRVTQPRPKYFIASLQSASTHRAGAKKRKEKKGLRRPGAKQT
eukprot:1157234-Pelagomonas_calceolata.AAC.12